MSTLSPLGSVIASTEGYGIPGAIPTIANNPGDLENGNLGYGTLTTANGGQVTVYPTLASGQAALENQVSLMVNGGSSIYQPGMTVAQANSTYTGGASTTSWASKLGIDPNTTLGQLASGNIVGAVNSGIDAANSAVTGASTGTSGWNLEDFVMIVIGLILIAAGVFGFKSAQSVVINTVRTAAKTTVEAAG